jgi:6-pyruvoyltetrahydropterin/6-carboxytetrahydropterin synthase
MEVTLTRQYTFEAAHFLPRVADGHPCKRMHGHSYRLRVSLTGEPDPDGMLLDYLEIDRRLAPVLAVLDHHTLNEVPGLENPTVEVITPWILWRVIPAFLGFGVSVRLQEGTHAWCTASTPEGGDRP